MEMQICTKNEYLKYKKFNDHVFQQRLSERYEEIYNLYSELYQNDKMLDSMLDMIYDFYQKRSEKLKKIDEERLQDQNWYCKNDSIAIQIYVEQFAGTLKGIETKLDYLQKLGVKYIYALPFLKSPAGKSDGGFACSDFRNVREDLGTISDLEHLINLLHDRGMCFIMDFMIDNTSDEHEWAKRSKNGEIEYQNRYHFYDNWCIPNKYDSYGLMNKYFGDIAPDNFTFVPECKKIVMTTYYPYQWDLNFRNPIVFNEVLSNILFLTNLGVDILKFDNAENIWKKVGTNCLNLKPSYAVCQLIYLVTQIVCPGVESYFNLKRHQKKGKNISIDDKKEFFQNESGILIMDDLEDIEMTQNMQNQVGVYYMDEEEDCNDNVSIDITKEIGKIHDNKKWISRLWGSIALNDVNPIIRSIDTISNLFLNECFLTKVHTHNDINWSNGFGSEKNNFIGNGCGFHDCYRGGILTLHRFFNDYFSGNMPGSLSKGELFAENMVTGKARMCGTTASLLGLERSLIEVKNLMKNQKESKNLSHKIAITKGYIQTSINRILLMHAVACSMPSMFVLYYGDEVGNLNDYSYQKIDDICLDTRYVHRGKINWDLVNFIESEASSYQSKIFNGIKAMIDARIKCPFFTESEKTVFIKSYSINDYYEKGKKTECYPKEEMKQYEVDNSILIFKRIRSDNKFLLFMFNFSENSRDVGIKQNDAVGEFREMISGKIYDQINSFKIDGYGYLWFEPL